MKNMKTKAVLGAVGLALIYAFLSITYTILAMIKTPLCEAKGYSPDAFAIMFSLYSAGGMIATMFLGKIVTKFSPKALALFASLGPAVGFYLLSSVNSIAVVLAVGLVLGFMCNVAGFVLSNIFISKWFNAGRAKMLSLATISMNILSMAAAPLVAKLVTNYGVETVCKYYGIFITVITILIAVFMICGFPEDYGTEQVDIGKPAAVNNAGKTMASRDAYESYMPMGRILVMPVTIVIFLAVACFTIGLAMYAANVSDVFMSRGLNYEQASVCISIASFAGLITTALFGILSDKIGSKLALTIYGLIIAAVMFISSIVSGWAGAIILAMVVRAPACFSTMYGGLVVPPVYGSKKGPTLMGWLGTSQNVFSILAPVIASAVLAGTGNYARILPVAGVFYALMVVSVHFILNPKRIEEIKKADEPYRLKAESEKG